VSAHADDFVDVVSDLLEGSRRPNRRRFGELGGEFLASGG
jgi:hypothetical protein